MHKFSAIKDMVKKITNDKRRKEVVVAREGAGVFMSNTNYQRIET